MVRRDNGQKSFVKEEDIPATVEKLLQDIQDNMLAKAKAILEDKTTLVKTMTNSNRLLKAKAASSKPHGVVVQNAKQKSKTKQAPPSAFDPSKRRAHTGCVYCGKKPKKSATSQDPTKPRLS